MTTQPAPVKTNVSIVGIVLAIFGFFAMIASTGSAADSMDKAINTPTTAVSTPVESPKSDEPAGTSEQLAALATAQSYVDTFHFSEKGLREQMTSEHGSNFPKDAVDFALKNVKVDYNEEAAQAAKSYRETMNMSNAEIIQQLTSEYGDQFTKAQAEYGASQLGK